MRYTILNDYTESAGKYRDEVIDYFVNYFKGRDDSINLSATDLLFYDKDPKFFDDAKLVSPMELKKIVDDGNPIFVKGGEDDSMVAFIFREGQILSGVDCYDMLKEEQANSNEPQFEHEPEPVPEPGFLSKLVHTVFRIKTQSYRRYEEYQNNLKIYNRSQVLLRAENMAYNLLEDPYEEEVLENQNAKYINKLNINELGAVEDPKPHAEKATIASDLADYYQAGTSRFKKINDFLTNDKLSGAKIKESLIHVLEQEEGTKAYELAMNRLDSQLSNSFLNVPDGLSAHELLSFAENLMRNDGERGMDRALAAELYAASYVSSKRETEDLYRISEDEFEEYVEDSGDEKNWKYDKDTETYTDIRHEEVMRNARVKKNQQAENQTFDVDKKHNDVLSKIWNERREVRSAKETAMVEMLTEELSKDIENPDMKQIRRDIATGTAFRKMINMDRNEFEDFYNIARNNPSELKKRYVQALKDVTSKKTTTLENDLKNAKSKSHENQKKKDEVVMHK